VNLENARLVYVVSCVLLGFLILSPTLFAVFPLPEGERFSELWLLDSSHMIESGALNVLLNKPYTFYLGVGNQMGDLEYYTIYVKLLGPSEGLQETGSNLPSSAESIFEYNLFLRNNETWEKPFVFSFENVTFENDVAHLSTLSINSNEIGVDTTVVQDASDGGFYCKMLFELWIYNSTISALQYHNRFVQFWMNLNR
jgi:hypothetical protein